MWYCPPVENDDWYHVQALVVLAIVRSVKSNAT